MSSPRCVRPISHGDSPGGEQDQGWLRRGRHGSLRGRRGSVRGRHGSAWAEPRALAPPTGLFPPISSRCPPALANRDPLPSPPVPRPHRPPPGPLLPSRGRAGAAMVRAVVLLAPGGPAPCRVLYARSFGTPPGTGTGTGTGPAGPRQRLRRKEQLLAVARQVASQCQLLQSSLGRPSSPQLPQLPDEPMSLQDAPGGLFQMPPGDPFPERVTVVWLSVLALTFALVCEPQENLSLAEITLRRLAPRLLLSLRLLGPGADVLLRPDAADGLLDRLLPHGQMLFLNERFLQAVDRELGIKASR